MSDTGDPARRELALPQDWPGLDDTSAGVYIDHTKVKQIFKGLRDDLDSLIGHASPSMSATWSGSGTAPNLAGLGRVGPAETGQWAEAAQFGRNAEQSHIVLNDLYAKLIDRIEALSAAVEKAVTNYERAHADSSA
jgi:hypothetical protein